jgi:5,10-methenyltetrahydromethanopterin hydrogenase
MSTETIRATDNPALANKLAAEAISDREVAAPAPKVEIPLPPDSVVELPGGLFDPFDGVTTTAEIRELTGADEEVIARIGDPGKALLTILERATVKVGDKKADKETLDALLAGDREAILLAIRIATFGQEVKVGPVCPKCGEDQTFEIDLKKDVEMKTLDDGDRTFTLTCKAGKVVVNLPTGGAQKALVNATNKNAAELDTILLKSCVESIDGNPVVNIQQIKDLGLKDRRDLIKAITDRNPGPQLSEIKKTCKACDSEVSLPLTLADLFRE